jgi:hypothetical protein
LKNKVFKIACVAIPFALGAIYGFCVLWYQLPPYQLIRPAVILKNKEQFYDIPQIYLETDVTKLISIKKPEDVFRLRSELKIFLWGKPSIPLSTPSKITKDYIDERYKDISSLSRIDKLSTTMEFELESHAYHFFPKTPINKVVLYHQGHGGDFHKGKEVISKFLDNGYSVVGFSMPLLGLNNKKPTINFPSFGKIKITGHEQMKFLNPERGHPIKYFLEPVINVLNYLETNYTYSHTSMLGLSGGGWTTTLVSAIDTRVEYSFPIAGSLPMYLMSNAKSTKGKVTDFEQSAPELYRIANYLELYILGSYGDKRRQVQILNQFDICCFEGVRWKTYKDIVESRVQELGLGKFEILSDTSHHDHKVSSMVMNWVLNLLNFTNEKND